MEKDSLIKLVDFFKKLQIEETDVTSDEERNDGQLVVVVTYKYDGSLFTTNKLFYRNISILNGIKNKEELLRYFNTPVFWLDIVKHNWPQGSGDSDLEKLVINDIAPTGDQKFKDFLLTIANNNQTGNVQLITKEGRPAQYYHNLENNNHWHDLIRLIQAIIISGGNDVDKKYFSRLVFKWDGDKNTDRERSTLTDKAYYCNRSLINTLQQNIKQLQPEIAKMEIIELLKYKYQIILQGPPGSGKTRLAKHLASELTKSTALTENHIRTIIKAGHQISSATGYTNYLVKEIGSNNITIELAQENKSEYKPSYKEIVKAYEIKMWQGKQQGGNDPYAAAIAKFIYDKQGTDQIKLIQFHPAYSYEDFVRGIIAKSNGTTVEYKTENKILAEFAAKAHKNFIDSNKDTQSISKENWIEDEIRLFADSVQEIIDRDGKYVVNETVSLFSVDDDAFRYSGNNWSVENKQRMRFKDLITAYLKNVTTRQELKNTSDISASGKEHSTYYLKVLEKFNLFLADRPQFVETKTKVDLKKYVLIVDEINRANLPAVLGELIYALEYRGDAVESMYDIDGDRQLVLPPNLFIIGTMNTADRSVGHIDYAIRRRFAFVDVPPSETVIDEVIKDKQVRAKSKALYSLVSTLFTQSDLASDFQAKDVQLGHSYFLAETEEQLRLKLEHEIKPILREYLKDGILLDSAKDKIEDLNV